MSANDETVREILQILVSDALSQRIYLAEVSNAQPSDTQIPFALLHKLIVESANEPFGRLQIDRSSSQVFRAVVDLVEKSPFQELVSVDDRRGQLSLAEHLSRTDRISIGKYLLSITGAMG